MKSKKLLALGSALLLVAGFVSLGALPANAGNENNTNETTYWENQYPGSTCYKDNATYGSVTTDSSGIEGVTLTGAYQWVALIVNGGGGGVNQGDAIYPSPASGTQYNPPLTTGPSPQHPAVSHWIVCIDTTPPPVTTVPAVTFTDVCGIANDAIVGGVDTASIDYTITDGRTDGVGTVTVTAVPQPGYTFADGAYTGPWSHTFTNEPCPVVIETVPEVTFTDVCGVANDAIVGGVDTASIDYTITDGRTDGVGTVTVTAVPQPGYTFADGAYTGPWSHTFTNEPCPVVIETVPEVTFTDVCGVANDAIVGGVDTASIDYTITDGRTDGVGTVTVTAVPQPGYTFADGAYAGPWSHTFTNASCGDIQLIAPFAFDPTCPEEQDAASGYIQLDLKDHLHYAINGVPTNQAKNDVAPGTYTISVTVDDGYTLVGPSSWQITVNPPFCPPTLALLSTTASMSNITCSSAGSFTLAATEGIQWFVNGSATATPAGTYARTTPGVVNVEARLIDPVNDGWEDGAQTNWTFTFTNPVDCLPTLAFTGSDSAPLGLLLAGGFLLVGGAVVAVEKRLRREAR